MFVKILMVFSVLLCGVGCVAQTTPKAVESASKSAVEERPVELNVDQKEIAVYRYNNRLYVIGDEETKAAFVAHKHLPYTKTTLGAGPQGETVIYEVKKKDPAYTEDLMEKFNEIAWMLESNDIYTAWKYKGRIFVIGDATMNEKFSTHKHLPYTKTLLGAGPHGETVIFQVDKKNPELASTLENAYLR